MTAPHRAGVPDRATSRRSFRARAATLAARTTGRLSRMAGVGDGTAIGGRVATRVMPDYVRSLTTGKDVVLVSATNGKSTVATLLAAALTDQRPPAFNAGGSNMAEGVAMALAERPRSPKVVLEVDEMVLDAAARATRPGWVVLMNASREYTRGVSLEQTLDRWREALTDDGFAAVVIANADDPCVVAVCDGSVVPDRIVWVAGGLHWRDDARACRRCGEPVGWHEDGVHWSCGGCGLSRPEPQWSVSDGVLRGPGGASARAGVDLPGRWLESNMLFAVAAAATMGVPPALAVQRARQVSDVDGRYRIFDVDARGVRLFLVKNPASWAEAVSLATTSGGASIVLAMESFSIRDLTPGWDVDLTPLRDATVVVTGQRRLDVSVMLEVAGVDHTVVAAPLDAIRSLPPGEVHVIANYTAFKDLRRVLA